MFNKYVKSERNNTLWTQTVTYTKIRNCTPLMIELLPPKIHTNLFFVGTSTAILKVPSLPHSSLIHRVTSAPYSYVSQAINPQ
ncbi:hypothetical protein L1887_03306 [Cichorium endivia]|nr:hypothetical protein L1887_03306 [Cichorium endivia]